MSLEPIEIDPALGPLPKRISEWIEAGKRIKKQVDCFDYIPSSAELLYAYLQVIPGKRYCEWGSGAGIGLGIARSLGFEATGIEIHAELVERSRSLLHTFAFHADVVHASYHDVIIPADVVFVYCWPGQSNAVRARFDAVMPHGCWLLMAEGAERFSAFFHGSGAGVIDSKDDTL